MKRIHTLKRTIALFLAMLMAATSVAFADWDSFQGNNNNNGTSTYGVTSTSPTSTTVSLPNNGAWTGVDSEPLTHGSRVYAVYNGGSTIGGDASKFSDGKVGGARLACADASGANGGTMNPLWTVQLDASADNVSQISTPIIVSENVMYTAILHYENELQGTGTAGWSGNAVSEGEFSFGSGKTTASYTGLVLKGSGDDGYYQPQLVTDLMVTAGMKISGTATLTNQTTHTPYTLTAQGYTGSNLTFYAPSENAPLIPVGTYDLEVHITTNTAVSGESMKFLTSRWALYKVTGISGTSASNVSVAPVCAGYGQPNTPLKYDDGKLYFGIYEGDRCYYQYDASSETVVDDKFVPGTMIPFVPSGGEDFYYAGAAIIGTNVVFGSESGKVYMRPAGNFSGENPNGGQGDVIDLNAYQSDPGQVRSSVCYDAEDSGHAYIYLTSRNAFLWKAGITNSGFVSSDVNRMSIATGSATTSVSTPAVADSGLVYASVYGYDEEGNPEGHIVATLRSNISTTHKANSVYSGVIVQCSPVVYTEANNTDYVYFTTNVANGAGYCYQCQYASDSATCQWSVTPSSGGNGYAVQGFAMGTYTLRRNTYNFGVFGNDSNQLVICRMLVPASAR